MSREIPFDPQWLDQAVGGEDEEDALLPEGRATYSWERYSSGDKGEGWGHANRSHGRRRRRYEGDDRHSP